MSTCNNVDYQKVKITISQYSSCTDDQLERLRYNFATKYKINGSRIGITQIIRRIDSEIDLVVAILKSNGIEMQHSSIIYNFAQSVNQNRSNLLEFLVATNISSDIVLQIKPLTFNETVGTTIGCFNTVKSLLEFGNCTSNNIIPDSADKYPIIIAIILGVLAFFIITGSIMSIIPKTRNCIFGKREELSMYNLE